MSVSSDSDIDDSLDKLLDDLESKPAPPTTVKPKPTMPTMSKRKPPLQSSQKIKTSRSNSLEDEEDYGSLTNPMQQLPPSPKKTGFNSTGIPGLSSSRLKSASNPGGGGGLLGNLFGAEKVQVGNDMPKGRGTLRGPNRQVDPPQSRATEFSSTAKKPNSGFDWLGVGKDISPESTPILGRKPDKAQDPFDFKEPAPPLRSKVLPPFDVGEAFKPKANKLEPEFPATVKKPKQFEPETESGSGLPPFLEALTRGKAEVPPIRSVSPEPINVQNAIEPQGGGEPIAPTKKRIVQVRKPASAGPGISLSTLQVPSHVIDEEELKRMCSSLKQLYENQVEMLEKSYKEQMDCLIASHNRKEDMLKEEIKMIHKDYDERLGRLKGELAESDLKPFQTRSNRQEYMDVLNGLSEQLKSLQTNSIEKQKLKATPIDLTDDLNQLLDIKLSSFLNALEGSLRKVLTDDLRNLSTADEKITLQLNGISTQIQQQLFDKSSFLQPDAGGINSDVLTEYTRSFQSELHKITKEQGKLRELLVKSTVTTMTQSMDTKYEDNRRKDRLVTQIREFRRDFHRILHDFGTKQESIQKGQSGIESEQKQISQGLMDLSTWLQINHHQQYPQVSSPHHQNQHHNSLQTEMELRLLKEERNSISETMATMNVEKRRFQDEKIQIEAEKRDLERRRMQAQDLETTLRVKISDTEESKKQSETCKLEHVRLNSELARKMSDIERERIQSKLQRQRHDEERAELSREREFLAKLRHQYLCPGCLRLLRRDQGDGLDTTNSPRPQPWSKTNVANPHSTLKPVDTSVPEYLDIEKEGQKVKEAIRNYYGGTDAESIGIFKLSL